MGIVIDTNFFIDIENDRIDPEKLENFSAYGEAYIAAITMSELLTGVHLASSIEKRIKRSAFVESILSKIPVLAFDEEVARNYAVIYAYILTSGYRSTANCHDLQIAATALVHGYAVLTSNVSDFNKIPGIKILTP